MMGRLVSLTIENEVIAVTTRRRAADARFRCALHTINALSTVVPTAIVDTYKAAILHHGMLAHVPF